MNITDLQTGDMIAFRIQPNPADGQLNAGRWGLFKVLVVRANDMVTIALYRDISDALPRVGLLRRPQPLFENRFPSLKFRKGGLASVVTPLASSIVDLPEAQIIKSGTALSQYEKEVCVLIEHGTVVGSFTAWATVSMIIDEEDRALRDRPAWEADVARRTQENEARWKAQREREAQRLKGITLAQLALELPLSEWDGREKIIPPAYREAARTRIKELISVLQDIGPKPRRAAVRAELKACVEWFNTVDGTMGYAIETVEREEIYRTLEEICWACKQKPLVHEIENWRDW